MMSSSLSSWQSANNYRKEGDVVYGVYQGCGFSVSEEDGGKLFVFMLSANDNRAFDTFENALVDEGGELSQGQVGDVENYLAVFYDESVSSISLRQVRRKSQQAFICRQYGAASLRGMQRQPKTEPSPCAECAGSQADGIER